MSVEVIPANTNPFSADSDGDYYPDNVDDKPLEDDPMYICDASLNDSGFHQGSTISAPASDKFTDGELVVDNAAQTAKYVFTRRPNEFHQFVLTPESNSFYKFTSDAALSNYVTVSHEEGLIFKETIYDEPESDGTYFLKGGETYTIEIYGSTGSTAANLNYSFTVQQDNWVKAENGGKWTIGDTSYLSPWANTSTLAESEMYITPQLLVDATYSRINTPVTAQAVYSEHDIELVMRNIADSEKSEVNAILSGIVTVGGVAIVLFAPQTLIFKVVGDACTLIGGATFGYSILESFTVDHISEVIAEGNMHIYYTKHFAAPYNDNYNAWITAPYIRRVKNNAPGTVSTSITYQDVIEYCGLKNYDD